MIEQRDPAFWDRITAHPEVMDGALMGVPLSLSEVVTHPSVTPLASENGGYLFCQLDGAGRVFELHSIFAPDGWGREALTTGKAALVEMFSRGMQVLTTYQVEGKWRTQPPKSFGFAPQGDFAPALGVSVKTWLLTRTAWEASPAFRRMT